MEVHASRELRLPGSVVAIGAFDGVHRGHQRLLRSAVIRAARLVVPSIAYTFDPPPKAYFGGATLLSTLEEKLERLEGLGLDHAVVARFDESYAARSAESFLQELSELNPRESWVGHDFRFGKGQRGDVQLLGRRFRTRLLDPIQCQSGEVISSTRIRSLLAAGDPGCAENLLGLSAMVRNRVGTSPVWLEDPDLVARMDTAVPTGAEQQEYANIW